MIRLIEWLIHGRSLTWSIEKRVLVEAYWGDYDRYILKCNETGRLKVFNAY